MDKNAVLDSDLKPVLFSNSPIINNSSTETDSTDESHKYVSTSKTKKRRSSSLKRSSYHKSKRSRSRDRHYPSNRRNHRSRSRSRDSYKAYRKSKSNKKMHSKRSRSKSPRRNRSPKSHKNDRKKRYSTSKDSSPRRSYKRDNDTSKKMEETHGIKLPSYINSSAVNPVKYAELEQKRKLLWSKKDDSKKLNIDAWNASSVIASRGDDKKAAKFRKLMGIHDEPNTQNSLDLSKKEHEQAELFSRLDADYQSARSHTHTSRGVGLGYNQSAYIDPSAYLAGRREEN